MIKLDQCLVSYLAGFFDGEGCVYIARKGNGYYLIVTIQQVDSTPLVLIKNTYGGSLLKRQEKLRKRPIHILRLQNKMAIRFLEDIYPFCIVKRIEVAIALEFSRLPKFNRWHVASSSDKERMESFRLLLQILKRDDRMRGKVIEEPSYEKVRAMLE